MLAILGAALVVWVVLMVLGAVIHGAFWLLIAGAILFVVTGGIGWVKRKTISARR